MFRTRWARHLQHALEERIHQWLTTGDTAAVLVPAATAQARQPAELEAYAIAVALLPLAAWRAAGTGEDRERALTPYTTVAGHAAAHAVAAGHVERAVELLEQGRAVAWSQRLQLRTDLTAIWRVRPELAAAMEQTQTAFDMPRVNAGNQMRRTVAPPRRKP